MYRVPFKSIAQESGLSVRTLYRVMNNDGCVTPVTRRKAVRALNKFGYTCLSQRRNRTVVVNADHSNTFLLPLSMDLIKTLSPECNVLLVDGKSDRNGFFDTVSDASVLITTEAIPEPVMKKLRYVNPSCVVISLLCGGGGDLAIDSNDFQGGKLAAAHFLANGHRHVLVPVGNHPNHIDRMLAFKAEMEYRAPGARIEVVDYIPGRDCEESFWKRYFEEVRELPTAVFCPLGGVVDYFPYFAEKFALLSVPREISVIGYNRAEERGKQPLFPIDSIVFDLKKMIECCKNFALNPPLSGIDGTLHTLIEPQLVINGSVRNLTDGEGK